MEGESRTQQQQLENTFEGELDKMRKGGKWRKVWCVFTPTQFLYYKAKSDEFPSGSVPLLPPAEATLTGESAVFTVGTAAKSRLLTLRAASDDQARSIVERVNRRIASTDTNDAAAAVPVPHSFKRFKTAFLRSSTCGVCKKPIRGLGTQGFACQACKVQIHTKCFATTPADCKAFPLKKQTPPPPQATSVASSSSPSSPSHNNSSSKKKKDTSAPNSPQQQPHQQKQIIQQAQEQQQQQKAPDEEIFKKKIIAKAKREDEKKQLEIAKVLEEIENQKKPLYDEMYLREVDDANKVYDARIAPLLLELELRKAGK